MMNNKEVDKLIADTLDAHMEDVYRSFHVSDVTLSNKMQQQTNLGKLLIK